MGPITRTQNSAAAQLTCKFQSFKQTFGKVTRSFSITEKAPIRAFSYLKVPTSAFKFKILLRHFTNIECRLLQDATETPWFSNNKQTPPPPPTTTTTTTTATTTTTTPPPLTDRGYF